MSKKNKELYVILSIISLIGGIILAVFGIKSFFPSSVAGLDNEGYFCQENIFFDNANIANFKLNVGNSAGTGVIKVAVNSEEVLLKNIGKFSNFSKEASWEWLIKKDGMNEFEFKINNSKKELKIFNICVKMGLNHEIGCEYEKDQNAYLTYVLKNQEYNCDFNQ